MTGKEMKKLRREELLEMLIEQTKRGDDLEQEIAGLRQKLESREIVLQEAGTLADAALQLNDIFKAADCAAAQYLENVQKLAERQKEALERAEEETRRRTERQLSEAAEKCRAMEAESEQKCLAMKQAAQREADAYWAEVSQRIEKYLEDHEELTQWLLRRRESTAQEEEA